MLLPFETRDDVWRISGLVSHSASARTVALLGRSVWDVFMSNHWSVLEGAGRAGRLADRSSVVC